MNFFLKHRLRRRTALALVCGMLLSLGACSLQTAQTSPDPHAGLVEVPNGNGSTIWVPLYKKLGTADYAADEFVTDGSYIDYTGSEYVALRGIDVSEHQGEIDWNSVKNDGVQFAVIRTGYRGYKQGGLAEDRYFKKNIEGALAAGIRVGVYFFSQAISAEEGKQEAQYILSQIKDYKVTLPVFFDWERVDNVGETRVDAVTGDVITDACLAFCKEVKAAGYDTGVYFYRSLGYYDYKLDELEALSFWAGAPGSYPDFYYRHSFWQYTAEGTVSGIQAATDLDLWFETRAEAEKNGTADITPGGAMSPESSG